MPAKVIGIGGVSRSGKSTFAQKLKLKFKGKVLILSQDEYINSEDQIPMIQDRTDWEHPDSIDFQKLVSEIKLRGHDNDFILVEGLMAFHNQELRSHYDFTIMLTISKETFLKRRKKETRWGEEPEWYLAHVWESYLRYGLFEKVDLKIEQWSGDVTDSLMSAILSSHPFIKH